MKGVVRDSADELLVKQVVAAKQVTSASEGLVDKVMKMKLDGRGSDPLALKYEPDWIWYRRADLNIA